MSVNNRAREPVGESVKQGVDKHDVVILQKPTRSSQHNRVQRESKHESQDGASETVGIHAMRDVRVLVRRKGRRGEDLRVWVCKERG